MSRICTIYTICKSHVCSSGSPDPERRKKKTLPGPVARGPSHATRACERVSPAIVRVPNGSARDRPTPYGDREAAPPTVARGPVPRDRSCAQWLGEGQALARPSTWSKT